MKATEEAVHAMADYHTALENFDEPYPGDRFQFLDMPRYLDWLGGLEQQLLQSDKPVAKKMLALVPRLRTLANELVDEMSSAPLHMLTKCYVHGDLHCFNLFYDDEFNYTKIIDFDFARFDHRMADVLWSSRIFYYQALNRRYTHEEREDELFKIPLAVTEEILLENWTLIISQYRKYASLPNQELEMIGLFAKAAPLYVSRFFSLDNSVEECERHVGWFEWELDNSLEQQPLLERTIRQVLDALDAK